MASCTNYFYLEFLRGYHDFAKGYSYPVILKKHKTGFTAIYDNGDKDYQKGFNSLGLASEKVSVRVTRGGCNGLRTLTRWRGFLDSIADSAQGITKKDVDYLCGVNGDRGNFIIEHFNPRKYNSSWEDSMRASYARTDAVIFEDIKVNTLFENMKVAKQLAKKHIYQNPRRDWFELMMFVPNLTFPKFLKALRTVTKLAQWEANVNQLLMETRDNYFEETRLWSRI